MIFSTHLEEMPKVTVEDKKLSTGKYTILHIEFGFKGTDRVSLFAPNGMDADTFRKAIIEQLGGMT